MLFDCLGLRERIHKLDDQFDWEIGGIFFPIFKEGIYGDDSFIEYIDILCIESWYQ